jgi:hypothetical protein
LLLLVAYPLAARPKRPVFVHVADRSTKVGCTRLRSRLVIGEHTDGPAVVIDDDGERTLCCTHALVHFGQRLIHVDEERIGRGDNVDRRRRGVASFRERSRHVIGAEEPIDLAAVEEDRALHVMVEHRGRRLLDRRRSPDVNRLLYRR